MAIKYGKTQIQKMIAAIDQDHASVEDAALAALDAAEAILEDRAKFIVVGQLTGTSERTQIPASDPEAIKVALGYFSTEGDALSAAGSLWHSTASGDTFRCWVLPMFYGTPADLHATQKAKYAAAEAKAKDKAQEKAQADIRKRQEAMEERARGGKGSCENCQHQPYDHKRDGSSRGPCGLGECGCTKWKEKTK